MAVTRPDELTVATCALLLLQDTPRPVIAAPRESRGCAVKVTLSPTLRVALGGWTCTLATGTPVTVMLAIPLLPSMLAATWTTPARRAVTSPESVTVATAGSSAAQNASRSSTAPLASRASAWNETVEPTTMVIVEGVDGLGRVNTVDRARGAEQRQEQQQHAAGGNGGASGAAPRSRTSRTRHE